MYAAETTPNEVHGNPGITIIGAITAAGFGDKTVAEALGFVAVVMATVKVVGGFLVTDRMLEMFKSKSDREKQPRG